MNIEPTLTNSFNETALKEIIERIKKINGDLKKDDETLGYLIANNEEGNYAWVTKDGYILKIDKSKYYPTSAEIVTPSDPEHLLENDIKALKKRIKHSKNPMEKKSFEKQLNLVYKKRKQNGRCGKSV